VSLAGGELTARLRRPAHGVAPGQAMVAYRPDPAGDLVLGCATVTRTG
jgi:tRNA-specific 2-thiouridylase